MKRTRWIGVLLMTAAALCLPLTATALPSADVSVLSEETLSGGASLTISQATVDGGQQMLYTVEADPSTYTPAIGTKVAEKALVTDMTPIGVEGDTVAAINGDHFSFATGIPMGMAISNGRILTSHIPPHNADEYFFYVLGITDEGDVLTGEHPKMALSYTVGDHEGAVHRINRTREIWEEEQICLYTPDYGTHTGTDTAGTEYIIRVDEGEVTVGGTLKGTVIEQNDGNDSPIEDGTVVLSIHVLQSAETEYIAVGDEIEFSFGFEDEAWNDVTFMIGGNRVIVEDGEATPYDYKLGVFSAPQPRSAFGVKDDGTLVLVAADGRSDESRGMTANEMAEYMADDMDCAYAILLDGGGSTALAVDQGDGLAVVNVPSEERPVGNGLLLVKTGGGVPDGVWLWVLLGAVVVFAVGAVVFAVLYKPHGKNDQ
ncbi:MAG: phosphodiester glycosidase family protein [Clostridia bacterium]|nr:phosphodiester glycosidase family protein [Clostridia bacterium]